MREQTNKGYCKRKGVVISSCFLSKLLRFIVKRFYNFLYNLRCGLLCLLGYWKSINTGPTDNILCRRGQEPKQGPYPGFLNL